MINRKNKTISLSIEAMDYVETKAGELFGNNCSAFLNYLIMKEMGAADIKSKGREAANASHAPKIPKDKQKKLNSLGIDD